MNTFMVVGTLIAEPAYKLFDKGDSVVNAKVSDSRKLPDGSYEGIIVEVAFWNKQGEAFLNFFHKGDKVAVSGSIKKISTFQLKSGEVGANIVLQNAQWGFAGKNEGSGLPTATAEDGTEMTFGD